MSSLLVRLAIWLLRHGGEPAQAVRIEQRIALRAAVTDSIAAMRDSERFIAESRARLERLDAIGRNLAREPDDAKE